jgi:PEP-CTERM motif
MPPTTPPLTFGRHYGFDAVFPIPGPISNFFVSPTDLAYNQVFIAGSGFLPTWTVGKSDILGFDDIYDANSSGLIFAWVQSNLTLTSIDTSPPIPEPGTMLLLGSGLLAVALRQGRR